MKTAASVDGYIRQFPVPVQKLLKQMRQAIRKAAPKATEKIAYGMPAFFLEGNLVYFAAAKKHIGFYPGSVGVAAFEPKLDKYQWSKGTIQFPLDQPLPLALVAQITRFRVKQNLAKAASRAVKKKR